MRNSPENTFSDTIDAISPNLSKDANIQVGSEVFDQIQPKEEYTEANHTETIFKNQGQKRNFRAAKNKEYIVCS